MILVPGRCIYTWWEILPGRLVLVGLLSALTLGWAAVTAGQPDSSDPASGNTRRALAKASFGFKAGISFAQHCGTEEREPDYTVASHWRTGFAVGAFLYFPVTQRFGLQQEFAYVQRGSRQDIGVEILEIPTILDVSYEMDYIEIQALLRFAWLQWGYNELYSLSGTALCLKVRDRYTLTGQVSDGTETVPLHADSDMSEVDMFDFALIYGTGFEFSMLGRNLLIEYRFTMSWNTLAMPTYAYVPFGEEEILIDNEPVPLKNQNHLILFGVRF